MTDGSAGDQSGETDTGQDMTEEFWRRLILFALAEAFPAAWQQAARDQGVASDAWPDFLASLKQPVAQPETASVGGATDAWLSLLALALESAGTIETALKAIAEHAPRELDNASGAGSALRKLSDSLDGLLSRSIRLEQALSEDLKPVDEPYFWRATSSPPHAQSSAQLEGEQRQLDERTLAMLRSAAKAKGRTPEYEIERALTITRDLEQLLTTPDAKLVVKVGRQSLRVNLLDPAGETA